MSTAYHSKYYAFALTRRYPSDRIEKLGQSVFNARVDLNPHQIDAALFAFRSPLSRGAILADEVGLGKTIEASLILSQLWAERHRKVLCIVPASLRPQWADELREKFLIDSLVLEASNFKRLQKEGNPNPLLQHDTIVICSYQFARSKETEIKAVAWDLVIIDEAHRLRNVFKAGNKIARSIRESIGNKPKVLLTATPFQNNLLELYGLVSFIDPHIFGNEEGFRSRYGKSSDTPIGLEDLRRRVAPICKRTLRRQVAEYIQYTNRLSITQDFTQEDAEQRLYERVSAYLQREDAFGLPRGQRNLITLILRKILASSSFAIAGTLRRLIDRLSALRQAVLDEGKTIAIPLEETDFEGGADFQDEGDDSDRENATDTAPPPQSPEQRKQVADAIDSEIKELTEIRDLARSITKNAKGEALLAALRVGFSKSKELGAPEKALIFTESKRTQKYLRELLETHGFEGRLVCLNGTNTEPEVGRVYEGWLKRHEGEDCVTGTRSVDMRSALVEEFRDRAAIMIATESGAEGINLQFCNMVVNFDLPWNPQRIEQRIGRCHRYRQKFDVVVVNFINRSNAADMRVFQLLSNKLRLFEGVFGASDEILGAIESGIDFEQRIHAIYQTCRSTEEIDRAFDALQTEFDDQIQNRLQDTRRNLIEHFDEEVHSRLKVSKETTESEISRLEQRLWQLTRGELKGIDEFDDSTYSFNVRRWPKEFESLNAPLGRYTMITRRAGDGAHLYRMAHPLAQQIIQRAKAAQLSPAEVVFEYSKHPTKISVVESLKAKSGWLRISRISIKALEQEDHLLALAIDDEENPIDAEIAEKLFLVRGAIREPASCTSRVSEQLQRIEDSECSKVVANAADRNRAFFEEEIEKLENWAEDLKEGLELEIKRLDREIVELKKLARQAPGLEAKVEAHRQIKALEKKRTDKRKTLFDAQDEVDAKKETLIQNVEARLKQSVDREELFTVRWRVA